MMYLENAILIIWHNSEFLLISDSMKYSKIKVEYKYTFPSYLVLLGVS